MELQIYSREELENTLQRTSFPHTALISISDPLCSRTPKGYEPPGFSAHFFQLFPLALHDIDIDELDQYGLRWQTYFPEAAALARFIRQARKKGLAIICQCEHGQSRSAACAAAIRQYFDGDGICIFADYQYYPNKLVYHKLLDALQATAL